MIKYTARTVVPTSTMSYRIPMERTPTLMPVVDSPLGFMIYTPVVAVPIPSVAPVLTVRSSTPHPRWSSFLTLNVTALHQLLSHPHPVEPLPVPCCTPPERECGTPTHLLVPCLHSRPSRLEQMIASACPSKVRSFL